MWIQMRTFLLCIIALEFLIGGVVEWWILTGF